MNDVYNYIFKTLDGLERKHTVSIDGINRCLRICRHNKRTGSVLMILYAVSCLNNIAMAQRVTVLETKVKILEAARDFDREELYFLKERVARLESDESK